MMTAKLELQMGYSSDLEARTLELPLIDRRMSFFIILPDYLDPGLDKLEANFTKEHVKALMSTLQEEVVNLKLPRFRIEDTTDLMRDLTSLGVNHVATSGEADLGNMVSR